MMFYFAAESHEDMNLWVTSPSQPQHWHTRLRTFTFDPVEFKNGKQQSNEQIKEEFGFQNN